MILPVKTSSGGYNIYLERGALLKAGEYFNLDRRVLVVTDSGVPRQYSETVAKQCKTPFIVTVPEGETSKCFDEYKSLLSALVDNGFTRSDCVVAVGGGVVGDMAGTAASWCWTCRRTSFLRPSRPLTRTNSAGTRNRQMRERKKTDQWHSFISNTEPWAPARPPTP